jgi:phosphoribosylamine---glycine ligase
VPCSLFIPHWNDALRYRLASLTAATVAKLAVPLVNILIIGSGGREHALAWRFAQEGHDICAAPGNPGIERLGEIAASTDYLAVAEHLRPDLTVVGPEGPLASGIVDEFRQRGLPIFGPTREMARLEASKIYSKTFMQRLGIPTARFVQSSKADEALAALAQFNYPVVIKADGLATGKGVVIAGDRAQAESAIQSLGPQLVIEEFLEGEEVSFIVISDGRDVVAFEATQDHKAVGDGDTGPNTGGMGAYCDGRILSSTDSQRILDSIIAPVIHATSFTGFLYAGLMMAADGPKVLEFNVRLGDPETQPLMHRLAAESGLADVLMRAATGSIAGASLEWKPDPSVCVVLAAHGYPGKIRTGDAITGIDSATGDCGAEVFQAGTKLGPHGPETSGGRVLGVTASGPDLEAAVANAYAGVARIHFDGMHYRHDIAQKGLKRWPEHN